jgi:serine/threonine-protein kinase
MPPEESTSQRDLPPVAPGAPPARTGTAVLTEGEPHPLAHASTTAPVDGAASAATVEPTEDPRLGAVIAERYRLLERVGEGGMGAVYRGEHVTLRKRVAVKFLHPELSRIPDVVARFEREAVAAANLDHRNVVAAHDFGKTKDGLFFLVMEFVEGGSLRALLDKEHRLAPPRAVRIARHIAAALNRAHSLGIVHRDLKPENVVLVECDGDPDFAKVLDFGIAKVSPGKLGDGPALTQAGMVFGTPDYMAPEQALGSKVDHRADLYAFAVMVFEMLTGQRPFVGEDVMVVLGQHMTAPPPSASAVAPPGVLPPAVDAVLARALAKSPSERFESVLEFVEALESALGLVPAAGTLPPGFTGTPPYGVAAPVPSSITGAQPAAGPATGSGTLHTLITGYRDLRRDPRRHRLVIGGLAALAVLSLVIGLATRPSPAAREAARRPTPARPHALRPAPPPRPAPLAPVSPPVAHTNPAPAADTETSPGQGLPPALAAQLDEYRARPSVAVLLSAARGRQLRAVIAAFEQSRAQAPSDPIIAYVLGTLYARDRGRMALALERYADALRAQPGFAHDPTLLRDVVRAFAESNHPPPSAAALLTGPLARTAAPYLLETALNARKAGTRARALGMLASPTFASFYDDTARGLVDLSRARTCEEKLPVVERLGRVGDARALPYLRRIPRGRGCGILGLQLCNPCLEDALPAALAAIERRSQ